MNKLPNKVIYNTAYTLLFLIHVYENTHLDSTEETFTCGYTVRQFDSMFLYVNNLFFVLFYLAYFIYLAMCFCIYSFRSIFLTTFDAAGENKIKQI